MQAGKAAASLGREGLAGALGRLPNCPKKYKSEV